MKRTHLSLLLLASCLISFAQPPGKLMCGPVTFTAIVDQDGDDRDAIDWRMMTISFYENGSDTAFVLIQDVLSSESQILPMTNRVDNQDDVMAFFVDAKAMGLISFHINIPRTRINVGDLSSKAFIQFCTGQEDKETFRHHIFSNRRQHRFDDYIMTNICFYIADDQSDNYFWLRTLSKNCQQYIDSYNSMVDYANSICSTSEFYHCDN